MRGLGRADVHPEIGRARATSEMVRFDYGRMADQVQNARKDGMLIDFSRLICAHFGKIVEEMSAREGRPISAHNNKTLFLEAIDIWCRKRFCNHGRQGASWTTSPIDVIKHAMGPFYGSMELEDPSRYRMSRQPMPPAYVGTHEDAIATALGLCACLEIQPLQFRLGMNEGVPEHIWGRAQADGKWYDVDFSSPEFKLGDHRKFSEYEEVEIPL